MVQIHPSAQTTTDWKGCADHRVHRALKDHQDLPDLQDHQDPGVLMEHKDLWVLPVHKDSREQRGPWVLMALKDHQDPQAPRAQEDHMVTMQLSQEGLDQGH